ncbi:MAG: CusA/CzcA family heavy metal efflux RND transporter [Gemmatimonadaceae bacterium]|nr:CusA/CzcA family heavy metal efflux RND transporter [Gemmatimonadaceae bacterium]
MGTPEVGPAPDVDGTAPRPSFIDALIAWGVRSRGLVVALLLVLIGVGTWSALTVRLDAFPDLTDAQVSVLVDAPGLSPVEVERLVTFPVEVALNGLPNVQRVRSVSKYAFASITIVFADGVDLPRMRTLVSERLQMVRGAFPVGADAQLGPLASASSEMYMYLVEAPGRTLMEVRTIHDRLIRPRLRSIGGVAEVNSFGGLVRQAQVVVRPERLLSFGLTLHDVVTAVESNSAVAAGGYLEHQDQQYILRGLGQVESLDDLRRTVIRASAAGVPVLVGDVAEVRFGAEIRQGAVSVGGEGEVVSGIVMMMRGENSRDVAMRVRARVVEINRSLPPGVRVVSYYDQTDLIDRTIGTVRRNLVEGGLLVIAILLLFLGNLRAALLVAATIPLSLLFAFIGMRWLGLSANLMSLGAIDFGMIVDGSVVMAEQFVRTLQRDHARGAPAADAPQLRRRLLAAAHDVGRPIAFGVLIIMIVYLPIFSLEGLEARMFRPMSITVMIALFGSLLIALVAVPAVGTWVFRHGAQESPFARRVAHASERLYRAVLDIVIPHPRRTVAVAVAVFGAAMTLVPRLGTEFVPELDEGSLLIEVVRDPSISLSASLAMQREVELAVRESPEVRIVLSRVGRPEIGSDAMGIHQADVFVMLHPISRWRKGVSKDSLAAEIAHRVEQRVPGAAIAMTQPMKMRLDELVSGVRADLGIKVFGDDPAVNLDVAQRVARIVAGVAGATEVNVSATDGQGYLNVRLDRTAMARFGIPVAEVQEALETAVGGKPVATLVEGNYAVDITVYYPDELRASADAIRAITVPAPSGARVPLRQLAAVRQEPGPVQVNREGAQRFVPVQANVVGRDLGSFVADVQAALGRELQLPAGTFLVYGGQFENQARAMSRLKVVVPVAIVLIAALLYFSLQSWWLAALVLINLPFAAVGGVFALWARGLHLSVPSAIGFIALFGVAVLNGLVLLTTIQRLRSEGWEPAAAAIEGSILRLRPVLITALVASIGFLPVALSQGAGAEVQRPLATVVIGGLVTSTLLTLLVLPTVYALIEKRRSQG